MGVHPEFPKSPYAELFPEQRWFPGAEELRAKAYERLLPPLVARIRDEVYEWRKAGYEGASDTSKALLRWWFTQEHPLEGDDGATETFRYSFAQREAVETVIWLHDVRKARDKFDLLRFDASGAVSPKMFDEQILPDNGYHGHNWRDDFQITLHIQDEVRAHPPTGNIFLTNIHRVFLGDVREPSLDDPDLRDYFLAPFGQKPSARLPTRRRIWAR